MVMSIRFAFGLIPALLLLVQDATAHQASCILEVQLKDDDDYTPQGRPYVARFIPQNDLNSYYDCLDLGSSYPVDYYRKLVLTQLNLDERLSITAVKMNSDLGTKMTQKLGASYNDDNPVLVLQAGGTKLEDSEIDGANGMVQLFNRAHDNYIEFFMVIHGVDFVRTGGSKGATTRLRGFSTDLKLATKGSEWVATGGAAYSHVNIQKGSTKKILATYWDNNNGYTFVKDFEFGLDTFVCNGYARGVDAGEDKISMCACAMAFSENAAEDVGNRKRIVGVPTRDGCNYFEVKATSNIASEGGLSVEIQNSNVNCMNLGNGKKKKVNKMIETCNNGRYAYYDIY